MFDCDCLRISHAQRGFRRVSRTSKVKRESVKHSVNAESIPIISQCDVIWMDEN